MEGYKADIRKAKDKRLLPGMKARELTKRRMAAQEEDNTPPLEAAPADDEAAPPSPVKKKKKKKKAQPVEKEPEQPENAQTSPTKEAEIDAEEAAIEATADEVVAEQPKPQKQKPGERKVSKPSALPSPTSESLSTPGVRVGGAQHLHIGTYVYAPVCITKKEHYGLNLVFHGGGSPTPHGCIVDAPSMYSLLDVTNILVQCLGTREELVSSVTYFQRPTSGSQGHPTGDRQFRQLEFDVPTRNTAFPVREYDYSYYPLNRWKLTSKASF